jgi:peptide/nickel transport system permease protein
MLGASISFLGMGAQPPQPDWGLMIFEARHQIFMAPWTLIFPSIALIVLILSFNFLGDGLRDLFDPKETTAIFFR